MAYAQELIDLIDERVRLSTQGYAATGTVVTRTGSTTAMVTFDGSNKATPVKAFGDVNVAEGDRVGMVRLGVDWTIIGTFVRRQTVTWPLDAVSGQHRAVFGANTPPELQAYGILEAVLWYDTDKTSNIELGYFFIGSSNSLDGGANQKVLLFGNVDYPTPGVPSSAGIGNVKTNFQINMFNETALGFGYTIFKDSVIQIANSVPSVIMQASTTWDNGVSWQRQNGGAVSVAGDPGKGLVNYVLTSGAGTGSASTVAGAPFSTEIVCIQLTNHVFENGRCYAVGAFGGYNPSSNTTSGNFKIKAGTTTAGAQLWDYWWTPPIPGTGGGVGPGMISGPGFIKRVAGSNLTSSIVLTLLTNNAGTGQHYSDATHARGLWVMDVGVATDFPWATAI